MLQIQNKQPLYCNLYLSFTITMPLLSAGRGSVLQTSSKYIGILHSALLNLGDLPFDMILILLKRSLLAIGTLSGFLITPNSLESSQTSSKLHTV